jgi:hypothetical protein
MPAQIGSANSKNCLRLSILQAGYRNSDWTMMVRSNGLLMEAEEKYSFSTLIPFQLD